MVGAKNSVLGRDAKAVIDNFRTGMPMRFEVSNDDVTLNAVVVTIDEDSGRATAIERVSKDYHT